MVLREKYQKGNFTFAYYKAEREFQVEEYKNIEKIEFQDKYSIAEKSRDKIHKISCRREKLLKTFTKGIRKKLKR